MQCLQHHVSPPVSSNLFPAVHGVEMSSLHNLDFSSTTSVMDFYRRSSLEVEAVFRSFTLLSEEHTLSMNPVTSYGLKESIK